MPSKKIILNVHEAHGGYVVNISSESHIVGDLYIISDDKDIGVEIGKIITHALMSGDKVNIDS